MEQISDIISSFGHLAYPVIFLWTFLEGETIVIFGGYAGYHGILSPYWLMAVAWSGSFLGDQTWYYLGRRFGPRLLERFPKWKPGAVHVSELMHKYGVWFILSFRFVYGVRNVSSITIGMIHYPWRRFAVLNFIAAGVWAASFVGLGWGFGYLSDQLASALPEHMLGDTARIFGVSALALFIFVVVFVLRRHFRDKAAEEEAQKAAEKTD
jgi:membrane protein DedA with SNARE-associated domain